MLLFIFTLFLKFPIYAVEKASWTQEWKSAEQFTQEELDRAVTSSKWHLRSSALLQLEKKNFKRALGAARKLINDPALMVRSQAARVLGKSSLAQDKEILVRQLFSEANFHKGQSLFIRRDILKSLPVETISKNSVIVKKLLQDRDLKIRRYAATRLNLEERENE